MFKTTLISKLALAALTIASVTALTLPASASERGRIARENARIDQGVRSGELTYREYSQLDRGLDRIQAQRARDLRNNDGHLTAAERRQLNRELNRESDRIYFDKHNRADQPGV